MKTTLKDKLSDKLVNAFLKNKIISAIPKKFTKKLIEADKFRKLCESKIKEPVIGYKAGGTGIPLLKKLKEKEPFYASVYAINFLKSGKRVKINKSTLGIELEVCYLIKKSFFSSKGSITSKNVTKFISHMAPCIEVVGYRQKRKGITSFGDLCSDFGGNVKFLIGIKKRFPQLPHDIIQSSWSGIVSRTRNSSQIFEKIDNNVFVAGCYNGSGIGVGSLFGEQIAIKASNENTKEIETIEARNKPTWLPPQPFLNLAVKSRLFYERYRARSEI